MPTRHSPITFVAAFLTALAVLAPVGVRAETLWAATPSRLVSFDSATPGVLITDLPLSGLPSINHSVIGMDFRPSNGQLYALVRSGFPGDLEQLYTLDPATGAATLVGSLGINIVPSNIGMSFDPVADQIRITAYDGGPGQLRVDPNTGASLGPDTPMAYAAGDVNTGFAINMHGLGYSTPVLGATTAYGLVRGNTAANNFLIRIGDIGGVPNGAGSGQVHTIGSIGVTSASTWNFDISPTSGVAYAVDAGGTTNTLYSVDLITGAATSLGAIAATATLGFAAPPAPVPEPGSLLLLASSGLALILRRRQL
jgi:hypothetical protein